MDLYIGAVAMRPTRLLVLYLLWSVVEVHSRKAPYVSFMGNVLPNHAYVDLTQVGTLQCVTDLDTCCTRYQGSHSGSWIAPGDAIITGQTDIFQGYGDKVVVLYRNHRGDTSGIYRCDIATVAEPSVRESVYVGLYFSGGNSVRNIYIRAWIIHVSIFACHHFLSCCIACF